MNWAKPFLFALLMTTCTGCLVAQTTVGVGSGGAGIAVSTYGDAMLNGPADATSANRTGLQRLLDGDYGAAETLFRETLERYPGQPDAVYYLGLTRIYQEKREEGFNILRQYRDPHRFRITQAVHWWADYLEKKPELTPKKIHEVMNKNRVDAFNRHYRERNDMRRDSWGL